MARRSLSRAALVRRNIMSDKLLTRTEVAQLLRLSPRSVDRLRSKGLLPAIRLLPGAVRFRISDVEAFIQSQRATTQLRPG
jgi:excisionase family DNA binding protein